MHGYIGGPEQFFYALYTGTVRSFQSLAPFLHFEQTDTLTPAILTRIRNAAGDPEVTPQSLIKQFLKGTGLPCPQLFHDACGGLTFLLDVSKDAVCTEEFCPRHLAWAACGSPYIRSTGGKRLKVCKSDSLLWPASPFSIVDHLLFGSRQGVFAGPFPRPSRLSSNTGCQTGLALFPLLFPHCQIACGIHRQACDSYIS